VHGAIRLLRGRLVTGRRVQVAGDLWHGVVPDGAVYVGRRAPGLPVSRYANPVRVGKLAAVWHPSGAHPHDLHRDVFPVTDAAQAVRLYRRAIVVPGLCRIDVDVTRPGRGQWVPPTVEEILRDLGGRDLACWCSTGDPCHGDVLLTLAQPVEVPA